MSIQALDRIASVGHNKPRSLFQFLTWAGGLKQHPDLQASLDGKFGWMVRKSGMSLDDARVACIEEGFLDDSEERDSEPSINDLLDLIAAEARGHKQYRVHEALDAAEYEAEKVARGLPSPSLVTGTAAPRGKCGPGNGKNQTMTGSEFATLREKLGLSMAQVALALGIERRSAYRYEDGDRPIPDSIARLLRMYVKHGIPKGW